MGAEGPAEGMEQAPTSGESLSAPSTNQDEEAGAGMEDGVLLLDNLKKTKKQFTDLACPVHEF